MKIETIEELSASRLVVRNYKEKEAKENPLIIFSLWNRHLQAGKALR